MTTAHTRTIAYLSAVPVDRVKGVGPGAARKMAQAGVVSVADLLLHIPRRYLDRSQLFDLSSVPLGEEVTVAGVVQRFNKRRISGNRTMVEADVGDGTSLVHAVWFNPYINLEVGQEVALSGKAEIFRGRLQMKAPDVDALSGEDSLVTGRVVPIHPSLAGLGPRRLRVSIHNALRRARPIADSLPDEIVEKHGFVSRDTAFADIHFPETTVDADAARRRLVYDELFRLEMALALRKQRQSGKATGVRHVTVGELVARFVEDLPYRLTAAQERVIAEIRDDMGSPHPMHRLLQGEVGSGKTVVAVSALLAAVQGGYQGAVMAPTEVLAEQHYLGTVASLQRAGLAPSPDGADGASGTVSFFAEGGAAVTVGLLTSGSAARNDRVEGGVSRSEMHESVASGEIDIVVGTHSLIQEGVHFARLGLAVVDEQHRFGVYQRVQLREKTEAYDPDLLIMTATPIPRTLAMTLYGDLDVSLLDEMPPGRHPVVTVHVAKTSEGARYVRSVVRREAAAGHQAFVVCPLVEDSEKLEAKSATAEFDRLQAVYPELRLGLIHGQLRPAEKEEVMRLFREGFLDVLVATTVIEVGIDVPNATVMVIEDADRFGLSQLHQLRGRVGRGDAAAMCLLVAEPTTTEGEERIAAMVETTDGFRLAEEDLRIRGQGTVFGTRQAGVTDLKLADILRDAEILVAARHDAFALVQSDPDLSHHPAIAEEVAILLGEDVQWLTRS
jgi:ATP-dependent DNA helicase RecG